MVDSVALKFLQSRTFLSLADFSAALYNSGPPVT